MAIIIISTSISVDAFLSMDTIMQRLSQINTSKTIEQSWVDDGGEDIFLTTLNNFQSSETSSTLKGLSSITTSIQQQAQKSHFACSVTNSDILTVLYSNPQFIVDFYQNANISLSQEIGLQGNIKQSCERIFFCIGALQGDQAITDTTIQIPTCQNTIFTAYTTSQKLGTSYANLPLLNNNDNIYMDSVKENGLFDLMIDIKNIEDLLFDPGTTGPELPKMIYYSLPKTVTPPSNTTTNSPNNTTSPTNTNPNFNNNSNTTSNPNNPSTGTSTSSNPTTTSGPSLQSQIDDFLVDTTVLPSNTTSTPTSTYNTTINQAICLPEDYDLYNGNIVVLPTSGTDYWWNTTDTTGTTNSIDEFTTLQDDLINAMSGYIYTPTNPGGVGWTNYGQNFIQTNSAVPSTTPACSASCSTTEWTEKLICEGKCCMNSCSQISNISDRAICLSQCMCGEVSTANDMLRIKICRVPAQPSQVIAWKTITSIEQAVDEINQIFQQLKQNGALVKRTKTQEFLDSSFSSIKLHKILAFDIFVVVKPIYDVLQIDQIKDKIQQTHKRLSTLNNTTWTLWKWSDKNKYNLSASSTTQEQVEKLCQSQGETYNPITGKCEWWTSNKEILQSLSTTNSVFTNNDMIASFLSEHYNFWDEVYNQITQIQITAQNLRAKAESAQ